MSPRFQRWAASFPLTRPIARRKASALFDLVSGFVYSQILAACIRLRLLESLAAGPREVDELARRMSLSEEATIRLLRAAAALQLVEKISENSFALGEGGAALLGNPGVLAMVEHHALAYDDLRDPVALLRGEAGETKLSRFWSYAGRPGEADTEEAAAYSRLMAASLPLLADDVLDAYPMDRHRVLLDVGGGEGVFAMTAARRHPALSVMVFDLPEVANRARARFDSGGLGARAVCHGGSFLTDRLPVGADIVSLVRIVHDHDDTAVLTLLRSIRESLRPGGVLLIAEPMPLGSASDRVADAYFGFYLLAMGKGRARTPAEISDLLKTSGFHSSRALPTSRPLMSHVIIAQT
jgi:demethylspheroidene O-methyltransferase